MIESFVAVLVRDLPQGEGMILGKKENGSLSILLSPCKQQCFFPFPGLAGSRKITSQSNLAILAQQGKRSSSYMTVAAAAGISFPLIIITHRVEENNEPCYAQPTITFMQKA